MANNSTHRFVNGKHLEITFDSKGNILKAKGFGFLMWNSSPNIDKDLVGKHVDQLAEMLEKYAYTRDVYLIFEASVHVPLLKSLLKNSNN